MENQLKSLIQVTNTVMEISLEFSIPKLQYVRPLPRIRLGELDFTKFALPHILEPPEKHSFFLKFISLATQPGCFPEPTTCIGRADLLPTPCRFPPEAPWSSTSSSKPLVQLLQIPYAAIRSVRLLKFGGKRLKEKEADKLNLLLDPIPSKAKKLKANFTIPMKGSFLYSPHFKGNRWATRIPADHVPLFDETSS